MVCEWGVAAYGANHYGVNLQQLWSNKRMSSHVAEKGWVDVDSWDRTHASALGLFPAPDQEDPWANSDDKPPF